MLIATCSVRRRVMVGGRNCTGRQTRKQRPTEHGRIRMRQSATGLCACWWPAIRKLQANSTSSGVLRQAASTSTASLQTNNAVVHFREACPQPHWLHGASCGISDQRTAAQPCTAECECPGTSQTAYMSDILCMYATHHRRKDGHTMLAGSVDNATEDTKTLRLSCKRSTRAKFCSKL
jgi:hypothetical protein